MLILRVHEDADLSTRLLTYLILPRLKAHVADLVSLFASVEAAAYNEPRFKNAHGKPARVKYGGSHPSVQQVLKSAAQYRLLLSTIQGFHSRGLMGRETDKVWAKHCARHTVNLTPPGVPTSPYLKFDCEDGPIIQANLAGYCRHCLIHVLNIA